MSLARAKLGLSIKIFIKLGFSSNRVMTDKKSSTLLIYSNKGGEIYTENENVN